MWALLLMVPPLALAGDPGDASGERDPINIWPFYDERDDPVDRVHVRSGLGPLLESSRALDGSTQDLAIRPLYHRHEERQFRLLEWEGLYPVMTYTRSEEHWEFTFLYALNTRGEGSIPAEREERFDVFPFYLSGRSDTGETYRWILPFGGRALDRMGRDEIEFILFPLYVRTVFQGVERRYFPWPILSVSSGEKVRGFRFNPLVGYEVKEGVYERRYLLWPFFIQERKDLGGENPEESLLVFPFYMSQRSPASDNVSVLWLFNYVQNRPRQFEQWSLPWPFIVIARGETRTINRFLPFFTLERRLLRNELLLRELKTTDLAVLYPLYIHSEVETPDSLNVRDRIAWWLYSDVRETGKDGSSRRIDAMPFFRYIRDREGAIQFQTLAPVEAIMPGNEVFERNYSPLWALFTYRRNPQGDEVRSFLWNLVRHESTRSGWRLEVLGPLLAYREHGEETRLSILGGLLSSDVRSGVRSVRLFGEVVLSWRPEPQVAAVQDPAAGHR